jgi:hypothetical protein
VRINALLLMLTLMLVSALSDARCRTAGESASLATEYSTFPLYPAVRLVEIGHKRNVFPCK